MTLTDLCEKLRNWFDVCRHFGTFTIENGTMNLDFIREGQFYRLIGTKQSDGIVMLKDGKLQYVFGFSEQPILQEIPDDNVVFKGAVWELSFPLNFIKLWQDINVWETKNTEAINTPYQSESFGGYSRSLKTGNNGSLTVWDNFASDIARWQKI